MPTGLDLLNEKAAGATRGDRRRLRRTARDILEEMAKAPVVTAPAPPPAPGLFSRVASSAGEMLSHVFGRPPDLAEEQVALGDIAAEVLAPGQAPPRRGSGVTGAWEPEAEPVTALEAGASPSELVSPIPMRPTSPDWPEFIEWVYAAPGRSDRWVVIREQDAVLAEFRQHQKRVRSEPPRVLPGPPVQPGAAAAVAPPPAIAPVMSQVEVRRQAPGAAVEGIEAPRIPWPDGIGEPIKAPLLPWNATDQEYARHVAGERLAASPAPDDLTRRRPQRSTTMGAPPPLPITEPLPPPSAEEGVTSDLARDLAQARLGMAPEVDPVSSARTGRYVPSQRAQMFRVRRDAEMTEGPKYRAPETEAAMPMYEAISPATSRALEEQAVAEAEARRKGYVPARDLESVVTKIGETPRNELERLVARVKRAADHASQTNAFANLGRYLARKTDEAVGLNLEPFREPVEQLDPNSLLEGLVGVGGAFLAAAPLYGAGAKLGVEAARLALRPLAAKWIELGVASGLTVEEAAIAVEQALGTSRVAQALLRPGAASRVAGYAGPSVRAAQHAAGGLGAVGVADIVGEAAKQLSEEGKIAAPVEVAKRGALGAATGALGGALTGAMDPGALKLLADTGYWGLIAPLVQHGQTPAMENLIVAGVPAALLHLANKAAGAQRIEVLPAGRPWPRGAPEAARVGGEPPAEPGRTEAPQGPRPPEPTPPTPAPPAVPRQAPVTWSGWQPGTSRIPAFPLWTLTEDIPGHPKGSTVGATALREAGYEAPAPPEAAPEAKAIPPVAPAPEKPAEGEEEAPKAPVEPVPAPPKVEPATPPEAPKVEPLPVKPEPAEAGTFTLPRDLAGAKPRFGYGTDNYTLDFESDLDKALFTVAQTLKNKRDADYMAALRVVYPDSEEQTIRDLGRAVKDRVKLLVKGQDAAQPVRVPTIMRVPAAKAAPAPAPPAVTPKVEAGVGTTEDPPGAVWGGATRAETPAGSELSGRWGLAELDDLVVSHSPTGGENETYPQELQRRDRSRVASQDQVLGIANALSPLRLGESALGLHGAPWVAGRVVVGGNGRVNALRLVYGGATENLTKRRDAYRAWLTDSAERFGLTRAQVEAMRRPVLIQQMQNIGSADLSRVAEELNESGIARMSPTEQAMTDAGRLTPEILALWASNEAANPSTTENADFRRAFLEHVVGTADRGNLITAKGEPNPVFVQRMRHAIFAKTYGERAVERVADALDDNTRNISAALMNAAPRFVSLRAAAERGDLYPLDPSPDLAEAADTMSYLRDQGMSVETYLNQGDIFNTPLGREFLLFFDRNARSAKRMADILAKYADAWERAGHPQQGGLFGDTIPTAGEVLDAILAAEEGRDVTGPAAQLPTLRQNQARDRGGSAPPPGGKEGAPAAGAPGPAGGVAPGPRAVSADAKQAAIDRARGRLGRPAPPPGGVAETTRAYAVSDPARDADLLVDLFIVGQAEYEAGATDRAAWTERMRGDLGDEVQPHLDYLWELIDAGRELAQEVPHGKPAPTPVAGEAGGESPRGGPGGLPDLRRAGGIDVSQRRLILVRPEQTHRVEIERTPAAVRSALTDEQLQAAEKAIRAMEDAGAFLEADGTGAGKTRVILATASYFAAQGHPVVVIAPASVLKLQTVKGQRRVSGSYADDSAAMKVPIAVWWDGPIAPGRIYVTTYEKSKALPQVENAVLVFDEAHALKNAESARALAGMALARRARAVLFSTATPVDRPLHLDYLIRSGLFGDRTAESVYRSLGMRQRSITVRTKSGASFQKMIWEIDPNVGEETVFRRMRELFDGLTERGGMIKREVDMADMDVTFLPIPLPPGARETAQRIADGLSRGGVPEGLRKAIILMHQRRQQEPYKLPLAVLAAKRELDEGRQVVLFVSRVNYSEAVLKQKLYGFGGEVIDEIRHILAASEGSAGTLRRAVEALGITDIAELHGEAEEKASEAMEAFQSGRARVLIATPESGGIGINLDDRTGDRPRTVIMITAPFTATDTVQALGRVNRMTTKSDVRSIFLYSDLPLDAWNLGIVAMKLKALRATVRGGVEQIRPEDTTGVSERRRGRYTAGRGPSQQALPGAETEVGRRGEAAQLPLGVEAPPRPVAVEREPVPALPRTLPARGVVVQAGLTAEDYAKASPFIPADVLEGSGEEAGYVLGVRDALAGKQEPDDPNLGGAIQSAIYKGFRAVPATLRTERTAFGDQGLIPGTPGRAIPTGKIAPEEPQRPIEETPLFGQEAEARRRASDEAQGRLFEGRAAYRAIVGSPAFRRWFGDSKVVDEDGTPKVVYHGTGQPGFEAVDPAKLDPGALYGPGFYMTESAAIAGGTAGERTEIQFFPTREEAEAAPNRSGFVWSTGPEYHENAGKWAAAIKTPFTERRGYAHKVAPRNRPPAEINADVEALRRSPEHERMMAPGYLTEGERGEAERVIRDYELSGNEMYLDMVSGQPFNFPANAILERAGLRGAGGVYPLYAKIENPLDLDAPMTEAELTGVRRVIQHFADTPGAIQAPPEPVSVAAFDREMASTLAFARDSYGQDAQLSGAQVFDLLRNLYANPRTARRVFEYVGYDGFTHIGGRGDREHHRVWIAFKPTQVKSATGNVGTFSAEDASMVQEPRAPYASLPPDRFYSALRRAAEFRMPVKASADQVLATLRQTPGVKAEEIKDTGLEDWLRAQGDRPITRAEVLDYLRANEVRVEIKRLGAKDLGPIEWETNRRGVWWYDSPSVHEDRISFRIDALPSGAYHLKSLGGDEIHQTLEAAQARAKEIRGARRYRDTTRYGPASAPTLSLPNALPGTYVELLAKVPERVEPGETLAGEAGGGTPVAEAYVEPHFQESNVVFHVRAVEHDNEKGQRGLLIEEVQAQRFLEARRLREKMAKDAGTITDENADRLALLESAPFAKSWHERAFKEALDYALRLPPDAQGRRIEWIGWTPGQVQVDRYDLSKQADSLHYIKDVDGTYRVTAWKNERVLLERTDLREDALEGLVGKNIADKIIDNVGQDRSDEYAGVEFAGALTNIDLKIGGEWAYNLYDRALPNFVRGYVKKWGARVGQGHIDARDPAVMARADTLLGSIEVEQPPQPIHHVPITDAMRRAVLEEGQAAFEPRARYTRSRDATPQHEALAQQALFGVAGAGEGQSLSSVSGVLPGRRAKTFALGFRGSLTAEGIARDLAALGEVDLRGRKLVSAADAAVAFEVIRNPQVEAFWRFYLNDADEVVGHVMFTARLPGSAPVKSAATWAEEVPAILAEMEAVGATKVALGHNHPTGDPAASGSDVEMTRRYERDVPGFQYHVIKDGPTYGLIRAGDKPEVLDLPGAPAKDPLLTPAIPHRVIGVPIATSEDIAALLGSLKAADGQALILYAGGAERRVRGAQIVPLADLRNPATAETWFLDQGRAFGSSEVFVYTPKQDADFYRLADDLIRSGALRDYVFGPGVGHSAAGPEPVIPEFTPGQVRRVEKLGPRAAVESGRPTAVPAGGEPAIRAEEPAVPDQPRDEAGRFVAEERVLYVPDAEARRRGGRLLEAVRALPDTAQASQIIRALRAVVSDQELQASGLEGFLKFREGRRVSRDELGHFLQAPESVVPDLAEVGRVLAAPDYETWATKMAILVGEWARPHLPTTWTHMRGETTPGELPTGAIDADAGTLREIEGLVTDAAPGATVRVGDETFTRRPNAIFPWVPAEEGGQPLSTPALLGQIRARRASLGYAPGPAAPPVAAPGVAPPATGPGSPASFKLMSRIAEIMDIPVRVGRMRQPRGVLGIFKAPPPVSGGKVPDVIRLRTAEDIQTLAHEVGHYVSRLLWGSQWPGRRPSASQLARRTFYRTHEAELMALAAAHRKPSTEEGFAEFWRLYLTREAQARTSAPVLYGVLEAEVGQHDPALLASLRNIRDWYVAWRSMEPSERVRAHIMSSREVDREREDARLDMFSIVEQAMDRYARVFAATEAMTKGATLPAERDPRVLIRALSGAPRLVDLFLFKGRTNLPEVFVKMFGASKGGGGALDFATRRRAGPSLEEALEPVRNRVDDWKVYMIARRVQELFRRRDDRAVRQRESLMRAWEMQESDVDGIVAKYDGPEFRQAHDAYQKWNRAVLAYVRDSGLLAGEVAVRDPAGGPSRTMSLYDLITDLNQSHFPFHRFFEERAEIGVPAGGKLTNVRQPVRAMTGSGRLFLDPLDTAVRNLYVMVISAERHAVVRAFVDIAERTEGGGRWFERVPPESRATSFPIEEIRRQLEAAGVDPDALNNADLEAVLRVFRPDAYKTRENEEWVIGPNGRPVHYIVEPNLHRALTGMNVGDVSWLDGALSQLPAPGFRQLLSIFREGEVGKGLKGTLLNRKLWEALLFGPARLRRAGATLAPEFQGRNVLRDTFDRAMLSQVTAKGKVPVVWPWVDLVRAIAGVPKGLLSAIQHDEWYEARLRGGGEIASLPSLDLYDIQRRIDDVLTGRDGADWHTIYHPIQLARLIAATLEDVNRIAETRDVMEARGQRGTTASKSEMLVGGTASREGTVDFNMIGAMTKRLAINRLAAFFNANIQGNYRTYRAFRADPGRMAWFAFMTITLPSLLLWWAEHDDPRWAEIPQWQKDNSWIYLTGAVTEAQYAKMSKDQRRALMRQTVWRVPKPWLPGVVFGSVPERILDWAYGHTPRTLVESLTQTLGVAASMSLIPTPTMLEPILDNLVDYMSFFGRPVEGRGMKEKEAGYRVRPHTSRVARWIAGGFDTANEVARSTAGTKPVPEMLRSPLQVDHLLQSLGGGLERLGAEIVDWTVDFFDKNAPPKPERTWADIPGIRAFAVRFPTTQSESIDKFYDIYTDAQQAVNTYRPMVGPKKPKAGAPPVPERLAEQAEGYEKRRAALLLVAPALAKVAETLGVRRKEIRAIYDDKTKAPSTKRAEIEELVMDMIEAASDGVRQARDVERAVAAGAGSGRP